MAINVWVSEGNQIVKEIVTAEISLKVLVAHNCQMLDFAELSGAPSKSSLDLSQFGDHGLLEPNLIILFG